MNKFSVNFFSNRLKGAFFSFGLKESISEKIIYLYFTFFKNFYIPKIIQLIINKLRKDTRFQDIDLNNMQNDRMQLKNKAQEIYKHKNSILNTIDISDEFNKSLFKKGYADISSFFEIEADKFITETKKCKFFNSQVPLQSSLIEKKPDNTANYFSLRPDIENINFFFKDFLKNKKLKKIIETYLGGKSYLYSINTMLTKPSEKKHSVTNLHRDYDDKHFIVLFIYWTDTKKDDGSTFFIPGSHLSNSEDLNDGIFLEGSKGSVFLIDTFGWHSGNKNLKNDRLVSWLRFSRNQLNSASYDNKEYLFFDYYNNLWSKNI